MWVKKGYKFYNRSLKSWLQENDMKMYSTQNKGKSVVTERLARTLNNIDFNNDKYWHIQNLA